MTQVLGSLTAEDLSAITQISDQFGELIMAGDFARAASLYTPDATLMPPNHPAVSGRAGIEAWMASLPPVTRFRLEVDAIDGRADIAFVRGRFASTLQTAGGPVENSGKYLEIRRRQADGTWLMESDIFNSDLPAPAPAAAARAKIVVLYPAAADSGEFERAYAEDHVPMVTPGNFAGITKFVASRIVATPDGSPPPFQRIAELHFPSLESLRGAAASAGAQQAVAHAVSISTGGTPVFLVAEEETRTF